MHNSKRQLKDHDDDDDEATNRTKKQKAHQTLCRNRRSIFCVRNRLAGRNESEKCSMTLEFSTVDKGA
jgi:hypothetical protein